jgi:hypothetical protein
MRTQAIGIKSKGIGRGPCCLKNFYISRRLFPFLSCPRPQRMRTHFLLRCFSFFQPRLTLTPGIDPLPHRMVIAVSTGLGLLLVASISTLSESFSSILSSTFSAVPAPSTLTANATLHNFAKRDELSETKKIIYGCLIPVLVILSGVFAGLTLGYMSLDETQLNVLSISGTP